MGVLLRPWRATAGAVIACALAAGPAAAEDLNEAYGPSWNCSYITAGLPIYDSCRICEQQGLHFFRDTPDSGHCVPGTESAEETPAPPPKKLKPLHPHPPPSDAALPPGSPGAPDATPPRPRRDYWGAVAVALTEDHVAAGVAWNDETQDQAEERALAQCNERGVSGCHVVGTFRNGGCGFVTTGHSDDSVGWGIGATADAANEACTSRGLDCKPPAGGCTARP